MKSYWTEGFCIKGSENSFSLLLWYPKPETLLCSFDSGPWAGENRLPIPMFGGCARRDDGWGGLSSFISPASGVEWVDSYDAIWGGFVAVNAPLSLSSSKISSGMTFDTGMFGSKSALDCTGVKYSLLLAVLLRVTVEHRELQIFVPRKNVFFW